MRTRRGQRRIAAADEYEIAGNGAGFIDTRGLDCSVERGPEVDPVQDAHSGQQLLVRGQVESLVAVERRDLSEAVDRDRHADVVALEPRVEKVRSELLGDRRR